MRRVQIVRPDQVLGFNSQQFMALNALAAAAA
jgi:hypothetical protein